MPIAGLITAFVIPLWVPIDVCRYSGAAWTTAGFKRWFWLVVPAASVALSITAFVRSWTLLGVACLLLADGLVVYYLAKVRFLVRVGHDVHDPRASHPDPP